jgi:hypothetical protein
MPELPFQTAQHLAAAGTLRPSRYPPNADADHPGRKRRVWRNRVDRNYQLSETIRLRFVSGQHDLPPETPSGHYILQQITGFIDGGSRDASQNLESFDEDLYLTAHPDIAEAKAKGLCSSGAQHFQACGRRENRKYRMRVENTE